MTLPLTRTGRPNTSGTKGGFPSSRPLVAPSGSEYDPAQQAQFVGVLQQQLDDIRGTITAQANRFLTGTFTMAAAASKVVSDKNVHAVSTILLMPTNAAAGTLMGGTHSLYISARTEVTSFTVATADGGNAAGTETFQYIIIT